MPRVTSNNATTFFITGEEAFADLRERLESDAGPHATAYLLGWSFDQDVVLQPSSTTKTAADRYRAFSNAGGAVYAMLWNNFLPAYVAPTASGISLINGLPQSKAILDNRSPLAGRQNLGLESVDWVTVSATPEAPADLAKSEGVYPASMNSTSPCRRTGSSLTRSRL